MDKETCLPWYSWCFTIELGLSGSSVGQRALSLSSGSWGVAVAASGYGGR